MDPDAFWRQTPRLYQIVLAGRGKIVERDRYDRAWLARTTAVLVRHNTKSAKFPSVDDLVGRKTQASAKMTPAEVQSVFAGLRETAV